MRELIAKWRDEANHSELERGAALRKCADELEKQHHDESHGSYFHEGCPLCDKEMADEGMTRPVDAVEASVNFQLLLLENGAQIRGVL